MAQVIIEMKEYEKFLQNERWLQALAAAGLYDWTEVDMAYSKYKEWFGKEYE